MASVSRAPIERAKNPVFKPGLKAQRNTGLEAAAADDLEKVQTMELMEGSVVPASIIDAIAEARPTREAG